MDLKAYILFAHVELQRRLAGRGDFNFLQGWKPLEAGALPSVDSLTELLQNYGSLVTFSNFEAMCKEVEEFRTFQTVVLNEKMFWCATFFLRSSSMMLLIPWEKDGRIETYVMGDLIIGDCALVTGALNVAFEKHVMPREMHAAEPLRLNCG